MAMHLTLLVLFQQLTISPQPVEVGEPATLHYRDPEGGGAVVEVLDTVGGVEVAIGETDADGILRVSFDEPGLRRLAVQDAGRRVVAPLHVLPRQPRWPYALVCVPLGLALIYRSARGARRRVAAADA